MLGFHKLEGLGLFLVVDHLENENNDNLYAVHMYYFKIHSTQLCLVTFSLPEIRTLLMWLVCKNSFEAPDNEIRM